MTPDEHAARAEQLLRNADNIVQLHENSRDQLDAAAAAEVTAYATLAQAHATLSLRRPEAPRPRAG